MRIITGCHKMADVNHLSAETGILPVKDHLGLICKQFLASASRRNHQSHSTIKLASGSRPGRKHTIHTLQSRFGDAVEPFLIDGVLLEINYKKTLKSIHTKVVSDCKKRLTSKLLGTVPPEIDISEQSLPCRTRCVLSQV
jgi:hypothetical protein